MIHFVIGTRAQLFKMVPVMLECEKRQLEWRWIYTAQHKETIEASLKTFGLPQPDYTVVNWDTEAKTMSKMWYWLARLMLSLFGSKKILNGQTGKTSIVLTHGDTITTWWGALLGKLHGCKVMHIEAGMRSHNLLKPFPEEINRIITGVLTNYHFCENEGSVKNLRRYPGKKINMHYNTQADTIRFGLENCEKADIEMPKGKYVVATIHRFENIFNEQVFRTIISQLELVAEKFTILMPLHPATKPQLEKLGLLKRIESNPKIQLLPRLEYLPFIKILKHCEFGITDGGGNEEELYLMGKPALVMRESTERPWQKSFLSHHDTAKVKEFLKTYEKYRHAGLSKIKSPSGIIVDELEKFVAESQ